MLLGTATPLQVPVLPLKVVPLTPVPLLRLQLTRQTPRVGTNSWWYAYHMMKHVL